MIPGEKAKKLQKNKGRATPREDLYRGSPSKPLYKELSLSKHILNHALVIDTSCICFERYDLISRIFESMYKGDRQMGDFGIFVQIPETSS